jgi:hypothetical protein
VITRPKEHDIDRTGKRLLREVLEPLGWVVNDVQEDYGIDSNVQVFDGKHPTGSWFHVQLKSSSSSDYAADGSFVSQVLSVHHARHYTLEIREPVLVIHADVVSKSLYWYAPQLDREMASAIGATRAGTITIRIPTRQQLPTSAPEMLRTLDKIYLVLGSRELGSASTQSFAESLNHLPNQEALHRAFQEKNDTLKLVRIRELYQQGKLDDARPRAKAILDDLDSVIEVKFWAEIQLQAIDYRETLHAGKPQSELPKVILAHAKTLQKLTARGPRHLKFYSLIARQAAELDVMVQENSSLFLALHQHLQHSGNPMIALDVYVRKADLTRRIVLKYNRCVRLARYAANYPDRWVLGRALPTIVNAIGQYLITLQTEGNFDSERAFARSALQISKLAAWICHETNDQEGIVLAILSSLLTTRSQQSEAYCWAEQTANSLRDPARGDALRVIERTVKRWKGENVAGDYRGNTTWQIIQNMATALGIDLNDEDDPLVRGLKIAARDNTPERVLANCEHLLASQGAVGPTSRRIQHLFNIGTASSKVVHCTLHNYHKEGRELDTAYREFKQRHCDSCPDKKPRPEGWKYTEEVRLEIESRNYEFLLQLAGTEHGFRFSDKD